jgi:hypothetical protein
MSIIDGTASAAESRHQSQPNYELDSVEDFRFVPRDLAGTCRKLIESYHAIHGCSQLADMLWNSDARDIIECHRGLSQIFKNAAKSRYAKRANESLLLIATVIVAVEVLARDFSGWGKRFPVARREAEALLIDFPQRDRAWLMDKYLYPSLALHREIVRALSPPPNPQWLESVRPDI